MEKLKALQPIIIAALVCLSMFQFMQINKMKNDMDAMQSEIYSLENKLDKRSRSSVWNDIDKLERRLYTVETIIENQSRFFR
jgi:hypothetical protein